MTYQAVPQASLLAMPTWVVRRQNLLEAEIDNEIVALDIDSGSCYGLNSVGSRVWNLLESPISIQAICEKLLTEFDVDSATCERQVLDLLEELRAEGLIVVAENS